MRVFKFIIEKIKRFIEIWRHEYAKVLSFQRDYFNINDPYFIKCYAEYHASNFIGAAI